MEFKVRKTEKINFWYGEDCYPLSQPNFDDLELMEKMKDAGSTKESYQVAKQFFKNLGAPNEVIDSMGALDLIDTVVGFSSMIKEKTEQKKKDLS